VANAKRLTICCGTKYVRAHIFTLAPSLIGVKPELHCQAVLDIMPSHLNEGTWWNDNRGLYSLLVKFRESEASDLRDKVFALLGISSDARDTDALRPDYTQSLEEVVHSTSSFLFGSLGGFGKTLSLENRKGGEAVIRRLFWPRIDELGESSNLLEEAIDAGDKEVVKMLVDEGMRSNVQDLPLNTALYMASERNREAIVEMLLRKGANPNTRGEYYGNTLQAASSGGSVAIVSLLLNAGAEVNAEGGRFGNALQAASVRGHEAVVKVLLDKGADPNAQGGEYGNALQAASSGGHEAVVKLLLDKGADVNAQGRAYSNALYAASSGGYEEVVKLLLDKGANINAGGGCYGNALQVASSGGYEEVVKLLLDKGANVNAQGGYYGNALQVASERGHKAVVKLLLDKDADVSAQVKVLLDAGARRGRQGQLTGWISRQLTRSGFSWRSRGGDEGAA